MAKQQPDHPTLNVRVPHDLRRRVLIAKANTGRSIQELLIEWIEAGLAAVENPGKGKREGR